MCLPLSQRSKLRSLENHRLVIPNLVKSRFFFAFIAAPLHALAPTPPTPPAASPTTPPAKREVVPADACQPPRPYFLLISMANATRANGRVAKTSVKAAIQAKTAIQVRSKAKKKTKVNGTTKTAIQATRKKGKKLQGTAKRNFTEIDCLMEVRNTVQGLFAEFDRLTDV